MFGINSKQYLIAAFLLIMCLLPAVNISAEMISGIEAIEMTEEDTTEFIQYHVFEPLNVPLNLSGVVLNVSAQNGLCLLRFKDKMVVFEGDRQLYAFRFCAASESAWHCWIDQGNIIVKYQSELLLKICMETGEAKLYTFDSVKAPSNYGEITSGTLRGVKDIENGYYATNRIAANKPFLDYLLPTFDTVVWVKHGEKNVIYHDSNARHTQKIFILISATVWILGLGAIISYVIVYHKVIRKKVVIEKFSDIFYYHWKKG